MKLHILYHVERQPLFGSALMDELARHGYDVSPGTLYPTLHDMEQSGLLSREKRVEGGRARKYYRITAMGEETLRRGQEEALDLVCEWLDLEPDEVYAHLHSKSER